VTGLSTAGVPAGPPGTPVPSADIPQLLLHLRAAPPASVAILEGRPSAVERTLRGVTRYTPRTRILRARTTEEALSLAGSDDAVLVHPGADVGPMWLPRLRRLAYSHGVRAGVAAPGFRYLRRDAVRGSDVDIGSHVHLDLDLGPTGALPRRLYVLHRAGGGTPATNKDLMAELADVQESFLLECDGRSLQLFRWDGGLHPVRGWQAERRFRITDGWRQDYAVTVAQMLLDHQIELIHVRHLITHPLTTLPTVARLLGVPLILSTHDYYYVCPSVHLLDERDRFCGGKCTPDDGSCRLPTAFVRETPSLKHGWVHEWQRRSAEVIRSATVVVATTATAAQPYRTAFGAELEAKLRIIEHGRELGTHWAPLRRAAGGDRTRRPGPLRVLAPANWDPHKGSGYLRELATRIGPDVEWHVLGQRSDELADVATSHGEYRREELRSICERIEPDVVGLFSIWAETYSHTLTEAWALGLPVVATDIGAVAERVRRHGGGLLLPLEDLESAAATITALARDPARVAGLTAQVPRDQVRDAGTMAADYARLYREVSEG